MVHRILQFTQSIVFRYLLHRCESRDICFPESFVLSEQRASPMIREQGARGGLLIVVFLGAFRAGVRWSPEDLARIGRQEGGAQLASTAPMCLK